MKRFFRQIYDVRRGEGSITALMMINLMMIMVTYYFLKPARDSLFLTKLSSEDLPLVFILTALVSAPIVTMYSRAARTLRLNQLINLSLVAMVGCLVAFYFLIKLPYFWVPYAFYTWVSIYGALTTSQFWLLANGVYNAAQAKRIFPLLGLAAIIGSWVGGELTSIILIQFKGLGLGLENLLFFCGGFVLISILITNITWKKQKDPEEDRPTGRRSRTEKRESMFELFKLITGSRHLLLIVGLVSLTMMVASFVDFQFKAIAQNSFDNPQDLGAFFGTFYGRLSLASFLLQLLFSYSVIRKLGVGGIIMILPIALLLGSGAMLLSAGLVAAVILRGSDGAFKYSLDKTGRELLFLPIPIDVKAKTKMFIDLFVDRWFRGVAGAGLLFCIWAFGFDADRPLETMAYFSLVVVGLVAIWLGLTLVMRREYINTFRKALDRRTIDPSEIRINISDSSTVNTLIASLTAGSDREKAYALDMLVSVSDTKLCEPVMALTTHGEPDIRSKALKVLQRCGDSSLVEQVKQSLTDEDMDVRREALYFLFLHGDGRENFLNIYLQHPDTTMRSSALSCIAEYGTASDHALVDRALLESLMGESAENASVRMQVARSLGALADERFLDLLGRLMHDTDMRVVCRAALSAGRMQHRQFVPLLVQQLGNRRVRGCARDALVSYGTSVLGTLNDYLTDPHTAFAVRINIPRVLARVADQRAVDILTEALAEAPPHMKYYLVKALNHHRKHHPDLTFDSARIDTVLIAETRLYYESYQALHIQNGDSADPARKLLKRALVEKQEANLERIFRVLGLTYPPDDIYSAYLGVVSSHRALRASAVEFLDNLLSADLKRIIMPIIDEVSPENLLRQGDDLFGVRLASQREVLLYLVECDDVWLRACAMYVAREETDPDIRAALNRALNDPDPLIRETARLASSTGHGGER